MRIKALALGGCVALSAATALAIIPSTEVFLTSVGRGQGACPGGVCAEWRTMVWVTDASTTVTANVEIAFLKRGQSNLAPAVVNVSIGPGATEQFSDIFNDGFHLDGVFGALRLRSNVPIIVWARTYDSNVHTSKGVGGAGQDVQGVPFEGAIVAGKTTEVSGLAQDSGGVWRSNFGLVEAVGQNCTVKAELVDGSGAVQATKIYQLLPFEAIQPAIADIGGPHGTNQRVRFTVTAGGGGIIAFGSLIDNTTGDATTSDQARGNRISGTELAGTWTGSWDNVRYGSTGGMTIVITVDVPARTAQVHVTLTGTVFGGTAPPPETEAATLTPDGMDINVVSSFFGELTTNISPFGVITGQATLPAGSPVSKVAFFGYTDGKQMNAAYRLTFAPSQGGGEAGGFIGLTKS